MDKFSCVVQFVFLAVTLSCLIFSSLALSRLYSDNARYQEAICTLDTIHWVQDAKYRLFSDKASISNVTVGWQTFSYNIPQQCELSKYVAFLSSNCPTVGAQTQCWARIQPLSVKKSLPGDSGWLLGIVIPSILLIAYCVCWIVTNVKR